MNRIVLIFLVLISACAAPTEKEAWQGAWTAKWETDRKAPGYEIIPVDYSFEMNGRFDFAEDKVTISAYGFPKCIFQTDTTVFTQSWVLRGDTLELQNQPGEFGLQYKVLEQTSDIIRLQLVDDIFITLTK